MLIFAGLKVKQILKLKVLENSPKFCLHLKQKKVILFIIYINIFIFFLDNQQSVIDFSLANIGICIGLKKTKN